MQVIRVLFYSLSFSFLILISPLSFAQQVNSTPTASDPWIDSVFNSLSIIERVNQLILLVPGAGDEDKSMDFGGFLLDEAAPGSYQEKVRVLQEQSALKPLIFHEMGDPFGLKLDSVDRFGRTRSLAMVKEPYLFYELGAAIGIQCNQFEISALLIDRIALKKLFKSKEWALSEFNQGLIDNNILSLNALKIHDFQNGLFGFLQHLNSWDMIRCSLEEVDGLHQSIQDLITQDKLKIEDLEEKCKNVLAFKKQTKVGYSELDKEMPVLNNPDNLLLMEELVKYQIVATGLADVQLPIKTIENKKMAQLSIGNDERKVFNEYANNYTQVDYFEIAYTASDEAYAELWTKLNNYDLIICTYYNLHRFEELEGDQDGFLIFQHWVKDSGKDLSILFLDEQGITKGNLLVFGDSDLSNKLAAEVVFGGSGAYGRVSEFGWDTIIEIGNDVAHLNRFSYTVPESVGLNSEKLMKIDSIASSAIKAKAMPGCQILVAKDNKVVYQKVFGYHTYDSLRKVTNTDLYDLASVTKVSGALPCLMKLYEEGKFDLDATMGTYLPYFKRGNKKKLTYREILAHQSGLFPYIVYWKKAIKKNGKFRRKTFSQEKNRDFSYELTTGLYLHNDYRKKIYKYIRKSKVGDKKYSYSGLSFLLYPEIIESITGQQYEAYLYEHFYNPLGASSLTYNPLDKYKIEKITPTEYDSLFRKVQVHGKVHDEAAAVMEGVSSNAGLFANANDLAKLFQMYCNYGTYGSREYLNEETLMEFTRCQYPENENRRALGFDRPLPEPHENGNTAKSVSQLSFGHSGFTGTFAWADPEYNLVYIFLSNRVYQTRENRKLYQMNIRTNIQEVIYEAME